MIEENMLRGSLTSTQEAKGAMAFKGETGMSAYELAVKNGYQGTEQEWIDHFGLDLTGYLKTSDIIDNTWQGGTKKALSAEMGKGLNTLINGLSSDIQALEDRDVYSTTEQVVGAWINDKPIYRKTIDFGALPNATTKSVAHNISNLEYLVDLKAIGYNSTNYYFLPLSFVNPFGLNNSVGIYANNTDIIAVTSSDLSVYNSTYVTLEYTKTTD